MSAARAAQVTDEYGRPVPGASIYVYDLSGNSAAIYTDSGHTLAITQPIIADEFGNYTYYAADNFYREDIWFAGRLRLRENGVAVGDTAVQFEANLATLAPSKANIDAVSADLANINVVAGAVTNVNLVGGSISNVNAVGTSITAVVAVAGDLTNINTVAADVANINIVAASAANVNAIGPSITSVNICAANIAAIIDAPAQAAAAAASAALISPMMRTGTAVLTNLLEFLSPLDAVFTFVTNTMQWNVVDMVSKLGYGVGRLGRRIGDYFDPRVGMAITDSSGNVYVELGLDGVKAKSVTTEKINGGSANAIAQLLGPTPVTLSAATRIFAPVYGQSLALAYGGTSSLTANDVVALTTDQPYGSLIFHGGVRPDDINGLSSHNFDLSSLIPHIETTIGSQPNAAGETIMGGFQAMLFQLLNAYGLHVATPPFQTISAAIGQAETAIAVFRSGQTPFTWLTNAITAAKTLSGGGHNVQMPGWFWMQGESGQNDDGYIAQLTALAAEVDTAARGILTQQTDPAVCFTYQLDRAQAAHWYTEAQRLSPLVRIVAPMYPIMISGLRGVQTDNVHKGAYGYRHYGALCAVAYFCHYYLKRPWRPLQWSYDARGRLRCRVANGNLYIKYDVPHAGCLAFANGNELANWPVKQKGFYAFSSGGAEKPLSGVVISGRNEIGLIGCAPVAGDIIRVGYKDPTNAAAGSAATNLRDCQGDVLTFDDGGRIRLDNWALAQEHTLTSAELS